METEKFLLPAKKINRPSTQVGTGSFATASSSGDENVHVSNWVHCREQFQGCDMNELVFCHGAGLSENIAKFVHAFERRMHHEKLSQFAPTNWGRCTWVKPAEFWLFKDMRKSLFTILLRAGMRYNPEKDNFDEALYSINYSARTKEAIKLFMEGYTWPTNTGYGGWFDRFRNMKKDDVVKVMTKKPITNKMLLDYALGILNETTDSIKKQLSQPPTDAQILDHALKALNTDKTAYAEKMVAKETGHKAIMDYILGKLGKTKEQLTEDFKKNRSKKKPEEVTTKS